MEKGARQRQIVDILRETRANKVKELALLCNTTDMTIRRDLAELEKSGAVKRIHGGAVFNDFDKPSHSVEERLQWCREEKEAMGKLAVSFIKERSVVCMDGSSTVYAMVKSIPKDLHFTAITTCLRMAEALCKFPGIEVVMVGGTINHNTLICSNVLASDFLKQFEADVAFFSTKSLNPEKGTFEYDMSVVEEKRAIISIAKKSVLLVDHTKFEKNSFCLSIPIDEIDTVITDDATPEEMLESLRNRGKHLEIARNNNIFQKEGQI